jgi:hypothetical protein
MFTFILGALVGVIIGWTIPTPEKVRDIIDYILVKFK